MKEADLSQDFSRFINEHTPDYGIRARYHVGPERIIEKFKTIFEAQWWQVNVTNPFAEDEKGNPIKSSLIVDLKNET